MQTTDLKFPGDTPNALTVRREVAAIISHLEIAKADGVEVARSFSAFLADAAVKCPGFVPIDTPDNMALLTDGDVVEVASGRYTVRITNGKITDLDVA